MKFIALSLAAASMAVAAAPAVADAQVLPDALRAQARAERRAEREARRAAARQAPVVVTPPSVAFTPPRVVVTTPVVAPVYVAPPAYAVPARRPFVVPPPVYGGAPTNNWREMQQQRRIQLAAMRGQLTAREYDRLMRGQARIDALQAQAAADGVISPWEARQINQAQSFEQQRIARLQSNFRVRGGW